MNKFDRFTLLSVDAFSYEDDGSRHGRGRVVGMEMTTWRIFREEAKTTEYERLLNRCRLWLGRDVSDDAKTELSLLDVLSDYGVLRRIAEASRRRVYFQLHPRRRHELPRRLTNGQVESIRVAYAQGSSTFGSLAKYFAVSAAAINQVVTGSVYKSAGGPIHIPRPWRRRNQRHEIYHSLERARAADAVACLQRHQNQFDVVGASYQPRPRLRAASGEELNPANNNVAPEPSFTPGVTI